MSARKVSVLTKRSSTEADWGIELLHVLALDQCKRFVCQNSASTH